MRMVGESSETTLARIEAALARIEIAAKRPAPVEAGGDHGHANFRASVIQSLAQLDAVIAELERE